MIPKYLSPRNTIPLSNKYQLINIKPETEFIVILHYLDEHQGRAIIRRIDDVTGWDDQLCIEIFSGNVKETIQINQSKDNSLFTIFNTSIKLEPINLGYEQTIPKVIIQTDESTCYRSRMHSTIVMSLIDMNPEYEYRFLDSVDRRKFIKENFDQTILDAYDFLIPGAYRADLFRLCYLYINGGCYLDSKTVLLKPLREWLDRTDPIVLCGVVDYPHLISNAYIFCQKGISNFMDTILDIVNTVTNQSYRNGSLGISGPELLPKFFQNIPKKIKYHLYHDDSFINYHNTLVTPMNSDTILFYKFYKGYYDNYLTTTHYSTLFRSRQVYYKSKQEISNILIFVYPNTYPDVFDFSIDNDILTIERIDKNNGWTQSLKIKLINQKTNKEFLMEIGSSTVPRIQKRMVEEILDEDLDVHY